MHFQRHCSCVWQRSICPHRRWKLSVLHVIGTHLPVRTRFQWNLHDYHRCKSHRRRRCPSYHLYDAHKSTGLVTKHIGFASLLFVHSHLLWSSSHAHHRRLRNRYCVRWWSSTALKWPYLCLVYSHPLGVVRIATIRIHEGSYIQCRYACGDVTSHPRCYQFHQLHKTMNLSFCADECHAYACLDYLLTIQMSLFLFKYFKWNEISLRRNWTCSWWNLPWDSPEKARLHRAWCVW